jgi:fucose permease
MSGLALLAWVTREGSLAALLVALGVTVAGFALMTPALNALISRRSDPARQGGILGIAQSFSSLARIVGPVAGNRLFQKGSAYPLWLAVGMMAVGLTLVLMAAGRGRDYDGGKS